MVGTLGLALLASAVPACASQAEPAPVELDESSQAVTGTVSFDESCRTAPAGRPELGIVPSQVMRNIEIAQAYMRVAANSNAFRECMSAAISARTQVNPSRGVDFVGPYYACSGDPGTPTPTSVMSRILAPNGTRISCDYNTIGTSTGGYAFVGNIDAAGNELFTMGNALAVLNRAANCAYNPDGVPCVASGNYASTANVVLHELMHAQGYGHVKDIVWGLNDINVGDRRSDLTTPFTLDDFCGITPSPTPTNGVVDNVPSANPTPGIHPTYTTSIPYIAGICLETVLDWSQQANALSRDCGPNFAGLGMVETVLRDTPQTVATTCTRDPYVGAPYASRGGVPIPPRAPSSCTLSTACGATALDLQCDDNPNPVQLERRRIGASGGWQRSNNLYNADFEYRACAESLYGKACSALAVTPARFCIEELQYPDPIPFWRWPSWFNAHALKGVKNAPFAGGFVAVMPIPSGEGQAHAALSGTSGELASDFEGLAVGIYDPHHGRFPFVSPSVGEIPPVHGTAFTAAPSTSGLATVFGLGGTLAQGALSESLYVGSMHGGSGVPPVTQWTKLSLASSKGGPGARAHGAFASNDGGDHLFLFGGNTDQGPSGDLWSFDVTSNAWHQLAKASVFGIDARIDASIAAQGDHVAMFGGRDADGHPKGDLWIWSRAGKAVLAHTHVSPRAGAALTWVGDDLYIYGGDRDASGSDPSALLEVIDGKTFALKASHDAKVATHLGGALAVDADRALVLVPNTRNGDKSGGAYLGYAGALRLVPARMP
jgi:hypothetical protein